MRARRGTYNHRTPRTTALVPQGVAGLAAALLLLGLRVLLIGAERVLLRLLGDAAGPTESAAIFFAVGALVLLPFSHLGDLNSWGFLRLAVPSGLIYAVAYWFYVAALSAGDVAAVAPLSAANGLFVLAFAHLFHGEALTPPRVVGAVLIAAGGALLQRGSSAAGRGPALRAPAWQMLAYAGLSAVTRMLDKAHAATAAAPAGAYGFVVFAVVAASQGGLLLATGGLPRLGRALRERPGLCAAAGVCNGLSFLLLLVVLTRVPVSVAEPVTALSLPVTALLASRWLRQPVGARWLPTLAVVAGAWLLLAGGPRLPRLTGM